MRVYTFFIGTVLYVSAVCGSRVDSAAVYQHKKEIASLVTSRTHVRERVVYGALGGAALLGIYGLYRTSAPAPQVVPSSSFVHEHAQTLTQLIQLYQTHKLEEKQAPFIMRAVSWLAKTGSAMVVQSLILRMLEPLYAHVKHLVIADVPLVKQHFWFLAESPTYGRSTQPVVMVNKDLALFVTHVEGLAVAYHDHNYALVHDSAAFILAHVGYVAEQVTLYDAYTIEKVTAELHTLFDLLLDDVQAHTHNAVRMDDVISCLRQLHRVAYYTSNN